MLGSLPETYFIVALWRCLMSSGTIAGTDGSMGQCGNQEKSDAGEAKPSEAAQCAGSDASICDVGSRSNARRDLGSGTTRRRQDSAGCQLSKDEKKPKEFGFSLMSAITISRRFSIICRRQLKRPKASFRYRYSQPNIWATFPPSRDITSASSSNGCDCPP